MHSNNVEKTEEPNSEWISEALHDLCQPLTALQCRLVIGRMNCDKGPEQEVTTLHSAVSESLIQCQRLMILVREMQIRLCQTE